MGDDTINGVDGQIAADTYQFRRFLNPRK